MSDIPACPILGCTQPQCEPLRSLYVCDDHYASEMFSKRDSLRNWVIDLQTTISRQDQEISRLNRGLTWAHYELAEKLDKANTAWLMYFLEGLMSGMTADDAGMKAWDRTR